MGKESGAENAGNGRSYADMSITGAAGGAGGEQWGDAGSAPSVSGKQGTPAMSVASSKALLEVPMVGDNNNKIS